MTIEQGSAEAVVKIRVQTRRAWIVFLVIGGCYFAMSAFLLTGSWPWFLLILIPLPIACCIIAFALALRTLGVDLTPEFAVVHGFLHHRAVPWREVQAVASHLDSNGTSAVWLLLENGESVPLRYPTSSWRKGDASYEQDFQRIDQWWLAHRGEPWRTVSPEAPRSHRGRRRGRLTPSTRWTGR